MLIHTCEYVARRSGRNGQHGVNGAPRHCRAITECADVERHGPFMRQCGEAGRIQRARRAGDRSRRHVGFTEQRRKVRVRVNLANLKL